MPAFSRPVFQSEQSQNTVEFFKNANNPVIQGSSFHIDNSTNLLTRKDGFLILQEHVAPAAFHNSKQRVDPPRCHPYTRGAVLDEICEWIIGNMPREKWIAWLNGAAGAGKSAICQSIAERCIQDEILVASFFFFRADSTRNAIDPLVATLAYQIIQLLPETKDHIVQAIELNPLIFEQTFEDQLDVLIVRPLCLHQISHPALKLLLIIDGVDECTDEKSQIGLIRTMARLSRTEDFPFIVLFSSRRENQILMAFNPRDMKGILKQIPLDNNYHPEEDILGFLLASFEEIKQTHPYSKSLGADWPSPDHVSEIVHKSLGQFIYASVVIHFLSDPVASPSARLDIVRGLRPSGRLTPFAELDLLYHYLFSQVKDISSALDVLAYVIFSGGFSVTSIKNLFGLEVADIQEIFAPLASVLVFGPDWSYINFSHASLTDFLRDKARSGEYCINGLAAPSCIRWFKAAQSGHFRDLSSWEQNWEICHLLEHAEATDELYASLILYKPSQHSSAYEWRIFPHKFLTAVRIMDFGDGGKAYANMLNTVVRFAKMDFPRCIPYIKKEHNISHILAKIASEEEAYFSSESGSDAEPDDG